VQLDDEAIEDSCLVIAHKGAQVFARRLIRDRTNPGWVALSSETENPLRRPPSILIKADQIRLLKVVGILFEDEAPRLRISGDAQSIETTDVLDTLEVAFRVKQNSAEPLAIEKQIVLGGPQISISEINSLEGSLVAIETTDGQQVFKRVGAAVNGLPRARYFESIGGRGNLIVASLDSTPSVSNRLPAVRSVRRILGVLYI
jgi:hypothetical protein